MALKYSSMLDLGTTVPEFELVNVLNDMSLHPFPCKITSLVLLW